MIWVTWRQIAAGSLFCLALIGAKAAASTPAGHLVGTVTSTPIGYRIVVDDQAYNVIQTMQMGNLLSSLKKGDEVELIMNGSPFEKHAKVINIFKLSKQEGE